MTEEKSAGYEEEPIEDLLEQAQSNGQATIIGTVGFLLARKIPVSDWVSFLGDSFGRAWDEPSPWEAGEFLDAMLTNFRSVGAEITASTLGPDRAEATLTGFPDLALCQMLGVDVDAVAEFCGVPAPIAAARSLSWTWHREGENISILVAKELPESE